MKKNIEIPNELKDAALDGVEKELFPKPAKKTGGVILRVLWSVFRVFASKKKINIKT